MFIPVGCLNRPTDTNFDFHFILKITPSNNTMNYNIIAPALNYSHLHIKNPENLLENLTIIGNASYELVTTQYGNGIQISATGQIELLITKKVNHKAHLDMRYGNDYYIYMDTNADNLTVSFSEIIRFENNEEGRTYRTQGDITKGWQVLENMDEGWSD